MKPMFRNHSFVNYRVFDDVSPTFDRPKRSSGGRDLGAAAPVKAWNQRSLGVPGSARSSVSSLRIRVHDVVRDLAHTRIAVGRYRTVSGIVVLNRG